VRKLILFISLFFLIGPKDIYAQEKMNIEIVCFGQIESITLDYLKNNLSEIFKAQVYKGITYDLPENAYNKKRKQYLASSILYNLSKPKDKNHKTLAIIGKDLYVPELNFVFGLADTLRGACIISTARLKQTHYSLPEDKDLFLRRTLKEAVHEIGHLLNLNHCPDSSCVMHFSNSLLDTDRKDYNFCNNCKKFLP